VSKEPTSRMHRLRRAEVFGLSAVLAMFVSVAVLGVVVWRRGQDGPQAVSVQVTALATPSATQTPRGTAVAPSVVTLGIVPLPALENRTATKPSPLDLIPDWPNDRAVSLLLLGLDRRPGESGGRTDAMLLVRMEPASHTATFVSIPRDLCVGSCGTEPYRINSMLQSEGPDRLRTTVGALLGVKVDYWMAVDFGGFRRLVDFFGGVDIEVPERIYDEKYPNEKDTGYEPLLIPAGLNHFDGGTALRYVRTRHQDGAFARDRRQQQVVMAVAKQVISPQTLLQAPALLSQINRLFETNVPLDLAPSIAKLAMQISPERVSAGSIDPSNGLVSEVIAQSGAYVLSPHVPRIQAFVAGLIRKGETMTPPSPDPQQPQVAERQHTEP